MQQIPDPALQPGSFAFSLNFYNKDLDKKKAKIIRFICKEQTQPEKVTPKKSWLNVYGYPKQATSFKPLEFNITYCIERQMNIEWQKKLEEQLGMLPTHKIDKTNFDQDDCYQFHGYVKKKNRWTFYDNRFIVLTLKWMINADAGFDDAKCKNFKFKKFLWRSPLAALRSV